MATQIGRTATGLIYTADKAKHQPSGYEIVGRWGGGSRHSGGDAKSRLDFWEKNQEKMPEVVEFIRKAKEYMAKQKSD